MVFDPNHELVEELMTIPIIQPGPTPAERVVELGLEVEEVRETLVRVRGKSRSELIRAIGHTGMATVAFCIEAWATWRGDPVFGWAIFVLFAGFAAFFWSRRRKTEKKVGSLEDDLRLLEGKRESSPASVLEAGA